LVDVDAFSRDDELGGVPATGEDAQARNLAAHGGHGGLKSTATLSEMHSASLQILDSISLCPGPDVIGQN